MYQQQDLVLFATQLAALAHQQVFVLDVKQAIYCLQESVTLYAHQIARLAQATQCVLPA